MATGDDLHGIDVLSVWLASDRPVRDFRNADVAFMPVTRFNLRLAAGPNTRSTHLDGRHLVESPDYDAFWRNRIDIFERVCLPSVLNLTPRPDAWYILFGEMRPPYIRELIERLEMYPWIKPYARNRQDANAPPPLTEVLGAHVRALGKNYLCSTRFDSDDSLHQQFYGALDKAISQLRTRGMGEQTRCLNLLYGLVQSDGDLLVYLRRTMFESVFEHVDDLKGPYRGAHDEIQSLMPVAEIVTNLPMWIYYRHGDNLDPPGVFGRDRLALPSMEPYLAPFGLQPEAIPIRAQPERMQGSGTAGVGAPVRDRRMLAADLRDAAYWNERQRRAASELAVSMKQPHLADWLRTPTNDSVDVAKVFDEVDSGEMLFLNAAMYALLATQLQDAGCAGDALRLLDYAILLAPADRHLRTVRDELAGSLVSEVDLDEQMELAQVEWPERAQTNVVLIVTAGIKASVDDEEAGRLHERAVNLVQGGSATHVVTLLPPDCDGDPRQAVSRDGVRYDYLVAETESIGEDGRRRSLVRQLAVQVAALQPCLLVADGSVIAQTICAAIGRAFRIPVEF